MGNRIQDKQYWASLCPALAKVKTPEDAKQYCDVTPSSFLGFEDLVLAAKPVLLFDTETCHLEADDPNSGEHWNCNFPGVRTECCDVMQAFSGCGKTDTECQRKGFEKVMPELQKAGFDMNRIQDK